jgi:hypothetical protein
VKKRRSHRSDRMLCVRVSEGIYNARCLGCLGEILRSINRFLVKYWYLYRLGRCLTKHLPYTNKHKYLAKCLIYFNKHHF